MKRVEVVAQHSKLSKGESSAHATSSKLYLD